jgi:hypothetical protein
VNKSTGTTGANPSTDTFLLAGFGSDGSVVGTWSAFTNGFDPAAAVTGGTRGVQAARELSGGARTGPFETTGTYTSDPASVSNVYGLLAAYRAADSPVVNPLAWMHGFEQGTHNGLGSSLLGTPGIVSAITGTVGTNVIVQAASARSAPSGYGCRLVASAAAVYLQASTTAAVHCTRSSKAMTRSDSMPSVVSGSTVS